MHILFDANAPRPLRYQQNFTGRRLAIAVLSSNQWPRMRAVADKIAKLVGFIQRGQIVYIDITEL